MAQKLKNRSLLPDEGGDISTRPQKEEGFCDAVFLDFEKAVHLLKHDAEKNMVKKAIDFYSNN